MEFQRFAKTEIDILPTTPGVYKFFNAENIIYVGKAKNLRKRVSSYFSRSQLDNRKTLKLVSEIQFIEVVSVNSEFDALLLENNLIKENQPKYNILLKDDKSFPSICITNERFPRVFATRRIDKSLGNYFGPYTSVKAMNSVLDLIRKIYTIRTCNFNLSQKNIDGNKFKVCLEYHLKNCLGPCEGLQTEEQYLEDISQAKEILKGRISVVRNSFQDAMLDAADKLNYELAQTFKEKIAYLEKFQASSLIVQSKITDIDVATILHENQNSIINFMVIENGTIKVSETVEAKNNLAESLEEILVTVLINLKNKYGSTNKEILSNIEISEWSEFQVSVPKIGDKKKLVNLSLQNALLRKNQKKNSHPAETRGKEILEELQEILKLKALPTHIECFDNSNIQGTNPVASMVCFKHGKPSKKDYRKFNIKTVEGPDDFGSMREVVGRRYKYLKEEKLPMPNLIVIDGGKGQLNAAIEALKALDLYGTIPLIGIAKRLEEIYMPEDTLPLHISKKSPALMLLQRIRDEAHRFAITFHKSKRSKSALQSDLDNITGIGPKTSALLLKAYGSVERIKDASKKDLERLIGIRKANILGTYFSSK